MSHPDEQPDTTPDICRTPGRCRPANQNGSARRRNVRTRDACPERPRLLDPDHEAFVEWFVSYWRRQGAKLFTGTMSKGA